MTRRPARCSASITWTLDAMDSRWLVCGSPISRMRVSRRRCARSAGRDLGAVTVRRGVDQAIDADRHRAILARGIADREIGDVRAASRLGLRGLVVSRLLSVSL